jgi:hypothetical protein
MRVLNNVLEAIGNTPLVRLNRIGNHTKSTFWAKLEYMLSEKDSSSPVEPSSRPPAETPAWASP